MHRSRSWNFRSTAPSSLRSTWTVRDGNDDELLIARERTRRAIARRAIDFVPDIGGLIPIPYNFDFLRVSRSLASSASLRSASSRQT